MVTSLSAKGRRDFPGIGWPGPSSYHEIGEGEEPDETCALPACFG